MDQEELDGASFVDDAAASYPGDSAEADQGEPSNFGELPDLGD
jgi:hypothetical protein